MSPLRRRAQSPEPALVIPGEAPAPPATDSAPVERLQRLVAWAAAAEVLDKPDGTQLLGEGELLEHIGRRLSFETLGSLIRARIAALCLEARSGSELGSLIRALGKPPAWLTGSDAARSALDPALSLPPGMAEMSLDEIISESRRLITEIEFERSSGQADSTAAG